MKRVSIPMFLLLVAAVSCGKSAPPEEPVREPAADTVPGDAGGGASEPAAEPADKTFTGTAVRTADGGPAGEGELTLSLAPDDTITGSLTIDGTTHRLSGLLDGERVRCWVRGGSGEPETARRGYVTGDKKGEGFEGTFAISGHGGIEPAEGTWKASPAR